MPGQFLSKKQDEKPLVPFSLVQFSHSVMSNSLRPHELQPTRPLSMGFSRQECWHGLPFPTTGDLPNPAIKPRSPALQADTLPSEPPGKSCIEERPVQISVHLITAIISTGYLYCLYEIPVFDSIFAIKLVEKQKLLSKSIRNSRESQL